MDSFRPLVRFAGFEGEWERVRLGELFERSSEKNDLTFGTDKIISVANMYFLKNERNVQDDYLRTYNVMRLGDIAFEGHKSKNFAHGRFVENTIGDGIVSHVFVVLKRANGDYDLNFWKYYINDENVMGSILTRSTKSSTMMNDIVVDDFLKESILVPSYEEQKVIGVFLTKLDEAITLQSQKLSKLKQIKAASLQNMFPQEGQMLPKVRFAGFEGEWERVRLGEIAQFFKGKGYSKNDLTEKGSPIFLYGMMYTKYRFAVNEVDTYTDKDFSSLLSQGNEVIIPASGETAEDIACASAFLIKDVILGGDLNVICFDLSLYSTPFIALSISNGSSRKYLSKCAQGKSVVHLRNSDIKTVVLSLPSLPEQQKISEYFTKLDRKIELETQKLAKLKQIKSACLSKMFV